MVEQADVILLVGSRTNQNGTDSWKLYPRDAKFIHLDADPMEIGRNYEALRLLGDAKLTLAALKDAMLAHGVATRAAARAEVTAAIAAAHADHARTTADITTRDSSPVRPERLMAELNKLLRPQDIVVADASYSSIWIANGLTARLGQRFLSPRGIAGLGWGLPIAIGAQIAAPDARVWCLCGDGGFAHSWAELETLRRLNLPINTLVLNNGILGYQKHAEEVRFGEHTKAVFFADTDHAMIARACGVEGWTLRSGDAAPEMLAKAAALGAPVLIDVMTDPAAHPPISAFAGQYPEPF